ncbi:Mycocerosic acid synthase [Nocardia africana]|uniref:Mycocerosic acid synthase n=1 Tax=Nocardia africana TaxID=134964 RepID=A0A378WVD7_9NOCA|nr:Mycocerosic acid synthase [Nocardia africana]
MAGLVCDGEDPDQARRDLLGGDIGPEVSCRTTGIEHCRDRVHDLAPRLRVADGTGLDHRQQRVEHAVLRRDPVAEQVHPLPHRNGRGLLGEQFPGAGGEAVDLVTVDRLHQGLAGREVTIERRDADAGAHGYAVGDRVFGAALSRAVADFVVVDANGDIVSGVAHHTPEGVDDRTAATLSIAGSTAAAALDVLGLGPDDTVLVGGAGGGVGVFAVQLARIAGARVIGTGSPSSAEYLRSLGVEPVAYGDGLIGRVRALDAGPVTAALDLHGTDTVHVARELGVPDGRICTIAAVVEGVPAANGANAAPDALDTIARLAAAGRLRVPIAATYPLEDIRAAVERQAARHVHGKVVVDLSSRR